MIGPGDLLTSEIAHDIVARAVTKHGGAHLDWSRGKAHRVTTSVPAIVVASLPHFARVRRFNVIMLVSPEFIGWSDTTVWDKVEDE